MLCEARLLSELSMEQLCRIHGKRDRETYQPREYLFRQGQPSTFLFAMRSGQVKITLSTPGGREQILGVRVGGQLLGFSAMHDDVHPYTAEALTEVQVCKVRRADILKVIEQNPRVALRIIEKLNQELAQAQALIRDLGLKSARERVASFLLSLIPDPSAQTHLIPLPLSRGEMAELLGLTIETVSRNLTKLKHEGLIRTAHSHVEVLDLARLRLAAGEIVVVAGHHHHPVARSA